MAECLAIIPARSGSKGLPHKNIRPVAGHPLLSWSIAAARRSRLVTRVIVSTDSPEYAEIARRYGAETPFLRPAELARDHSLDVDFLRHAVGWLEKNEGYRPDLLVHLRPTSPARDPAVIDQAIEAISADEAATSLVSVFPVEYPPCKYYRLNEDGYLGGYMGDEYLNRPRQLCPQAYRGSGYVDVIRPASLAAGGGQLGKRILPFITPDPGDLDGEDDWPGLEDALRKISIWLGGQME